MNRLIIFLLALAVTGCTKYVEVPVPYKVEVMVPVPCPKVELPPRPILAPVPESPREEILKSVLINLKKLSDYAQQLEAATPRE